VSSQNVCVAKSLVTNSNHVSNVGFEQCTKQGGRLEHWEKQNAQDRLHCMLPTSHAEPNGSFLFLSITTPALTIQNEQERWAMYMTMKGCLCAHDRTRRCLEMSACVTRPLPQIRFYRFCTCTCVWHCTIYITDIITVLEYSNVCLRSHIDG
jgi:putative hemolysin